MMNMFGVIVASRLVQTDFQRVGEAQFLINIPEADSINHIVVFMTGSEPFPEGMGGSVFFSWPDPIAPPSWLYLGYISNTKPSAIFKVNKLKPVGGNSSTHPFGVQQISHVAQIGISVEQLSQICLQTPVIANSPTNLDSFTEFATKMLENFYNYTASFATQVPGVTDQFVPLNCLHQWYQNFQRRLQQNPYFWRS